MSINKLWSFPMRVWGWFKKYNIDPESIAPELVKKINWLDYQINDLENNLSQTKFELSQALAIEARKRIWAKMDPKVLADLRTLKAEDKCSHRKGDGKVGSGAITTDYNVSMHTFPDASKRIRCNGCGKKWFPGKDGWKEAVEMVKQSTNIPSSSEIGMRAKK
jgi:hypothetical protein